MLSRFTVQMAISLNLIFNWLILLLTTSKWYHGDSNKQQWLLMEHLITEMPTELEFYALRIFATCCVAV